MALSHWLYPRAASGSAFPVPAAVSTTSPKRVVHVSSVAGHIPVFRAPIYGAAKFAITGFVRCLAPLEEQMGIRITAVSPGLVRTPLWMDHPEKLHNIDQEQDGWITPLEVAEAMLSCVEGNEHLGGTILEIGKDHTREVQAVNDPGPDLRPGAGIVASNGNVGDNEVREWLQDPCIWGLTK